MPPAQPTKSSPSSSESRLIRMSPVRNPGLSALAPSNPVSSETVKRASILPCSKELSSRIASCAAIPMPQSAPRVVSLAIIQPSSITYLMGSLEKSCVESAFFSQTISEWLWRITVGLFSYPLEASLMISTLPTLSVLHFRLCDAANSCKYAIICSS